MKIKKIHETLSIAKAIQKDVPKLGQPPDEGYSAQTQQILSFSVVKGTRGYIEKIVNQINGCYERGWFDGCAVMIRRLVETLIIECFEFYNLEDQIKNDNGDFLFLKDLVDRALNEKTWNLGRNTKKALPKLKDIGDKSAHSRRYIAHRRDIDKIIDDLRTVTQEFVYLANLK
ncbi:MAG: hypothetical protein KDE33_27745 [Bacteroidetes bacterium]|nr:hypothetical protein [Bacteroidota bacterium]